MLPGATLLALALLGASGCGTTGVSADPTSSTAPIPTAASTSGTAGTTAGTPAPTPSTEATTSTTAITTTLAPAPTTAPATTVPPPTTAAPTTAAPPPTRPPRPAPPKEGRPAPPEAIGLLGPPVVPDEGLWSPLGMAVDGAPAMYHTVVRSSLDGRTLAGLVWIDTTAVKGQLFAGTVQPPGPWSMPSHIPEELRPELLASFNSGFLLNECEGGFYLDGREGAVLKDGTAGVHIDVDGTMTVGVLGRDFTRGPNTASIRQNLRLLVDGGRVDPSATDRDTHVWGKTLGNIPNVWRSALGQRDDGTLVYVAGPAMSARTLGNLLVAGGAVRALELDINPNWVTFNIHTFDGKTGQAGSSKLLPNMVRSPDRYFTADDRDFFALFARPPVPTP